MKPPSRPSLKFQPSKNDLRASTRARRQIFELAEQK